MRTSHIVAALVASAVLLSGCGAGSSVSAPMPDIAVKPGAAPAGGSAGVPTRDGAEVAPKPPTDAAGVPYTAGDQRYVARSASLTMVVTDVHAAATQVRDIATKMSGWVASESLSLGAERNTYPYPYPSSGSWLTISVPTSRLDEAATAVEGIGTVRQRTASADDMTQTVVDTDARIRSLEASVTRLQELVERAGSVADIAAVERELSTRQADLEAMKSQRLYLSGLVERATLTVSLLTPDQSSTTNPVQTGLARGWAVFLESISVLIMVVAALLPFLLVGALIAVPLALWLRARSRRARARAQAAAAASDPKTDADSGLVGHQALVGVDAPDRQPDSPHDQGDGEGPAQHRP